VSAIVPVFNRSDSSAAAVDSRLAQTHSNLEITVIDAGSREDIVTALQMVLEHIRLLRQEPNRGAGAARNLGIKQASGSLIHFLDSDDLLEPDAIARKITALQAIPEADLVFTRARHEP
jgi:glycosyltransferase involved in cell wall biosynthesis